MRTGEWAQTRNGGWFGALFLTPLIGKEHTEAVPLCGQYSFVQGFQDTVNGEPVSVPLQSTGMLCGLCGRRLGGRSSPVEKRSECAVHVRIQVSPALTREDAELGLGDLENRQKHLASLMGGSVSPDVRPGQ